MRKVALLISLLYTDVITETFPYKVSYYAESGHGLSIRACRFESSWFRGHDLLHPCSWSPDSTESLINMDGLIPPSLIGLASYAVHGLQGEEASG